jgi:hypothetical protein
MNKIGSVFVVSSLYNYIKTRDGGDISFSFKISHINLNIDDSSLSGLSAFTNNSFWKGDSLVFI